MRTLNQPYFWIAFLSILLVSCQLIPDLEKLPSVEILSVNTELDRIVVVAEVSTENDYAIDEYGFEIQDFGASDRLISESVRKVITKPNANNRFTLEEDLDINESYNIRAYLRLGGNFIYSDTLTIGTNGIRVSTSFEIRDNQVLLFGNLSGLPDQFSVDQHGYCWVTLDEKVPNKNIRFFGTHNADSVLQLGEKRGSGEFSDEILELPRGKFTYVIPFAVYQGTEVYGNMIEVFIGDFWTTHNYIENPQSPGAISSGVSFVIGNYAYLGTGEKTNSGGIVTPTNEFWRFDPTEENLDSAWTRIEDFPGKSRYQAVAFTINGKAYVGLGRDQSNCFRDFYEYTPETGWMRKANFPNARYAAVAFTVGNYGYVGTGYHQCRGLSRRIYEFDPLNDEDGFDENGNPIGKWGRNALMPGVGRALAVGFSIGDKGYVSTGFLTSGYSQAIYEIDPLIQDSINSIGRPYGRSTRISSDFLGTPRQAATSFVINDKAYLGLGDNVKGRNGSFNDLYVFDPQTQIWSQKKDVGVENRHFSTSFAVNGKGYIYGGFFSFSTGSQASASLYIYTPNE